MKLKRSLFGLLAVLFGITLVACKDDEGEKEWQVPDSPMQICVGSESVWYYQEVLNKYVSDNNLPFTIKVTGVDTGSYADDFLLDPATGADIFVAAHDNLGKLLDGAGSIAPITDEDLIDNIDETIDPIFQDMIYLSVGGGQAQYYAVPIIRQSLVLFYNKNYLSASDVKTWEGILKVATAEKKLAVAFTGEDGFNYSHWLLAQPSNDAAKKAFGDKGTLQLYKGGLWANNMAWGDDQVAIHRYAQRFINEKYGRNGAVVGKSGWVSEAQNDQVISVVAGAWNIGTIDETWDNYGVAVLPTFKLTSSDAYGKAKSGMVFQSGSFYDVKCLMKKKDSAYAPYLDEIMYFLSSDEIQEGSYIYCNNLPASKNVELEYEESYIEENYNIDDVSYNIDLAKIQELQGETAGLPQPFGYNAKYNPAYYGKSSSLFVDLHQDKDTYNDGAKVKARLQWISYIWANDALPNNASEVTEWVNSLQ